MEGRNKEKTRGQNKRRIKVCEKGNRDERTNKVTNGLHGFPWVIDFGLSD